MEEIEYITLLVKIWLQGFLIFASAWVLHDAYKSCFYGFLRDRHNLTRIFGSVMFILLIVLSRYVMEYLTRHIFIGRQPSGIEYYFIASLGIFFCYVYLSDKDTKRYSNLAGQKVVDLPYRKALMQPLYIVADVTNCEPALFHRQSEILIESTDFHKIAELFPNVLLKKNQHYCYCNKWYEVVDVWVQNWSIVAPFKPVDSEVLGVGIPHYIDVHIFLKCID